MSLEQQLSDAIAAQNALTQAVAAKKGEIDAATAAQSAAFTAWMNNAKNNFAANTLSNLFVGGSSSKWYPVIFSLPGRVLGRLNIGRNIHDDNAIYGMGNGSMNFSLDVVSGEWGGSPGRVIPQSYQYVLGAGFANPFVADYALDIYGMYLVVYLLGNRSYEISASWNCTVTAFTADVGNKIFANQQGGNNYDVIRDAETAVAASMTPNNYLRGG